MICPGTLREIKILTFGFRSHDVLYLTLEAMMSYILALEARCPIFNFRSHDVLYFGFRSYGVLYLTLEAMVSYI